MIKKGSLVRHKTGGPLLCVEDVYMGRVKSVSYWCTESKKVKAFNVSADSGWSFRKVLTPFQKSVLTFSIISIGFFIALKFIV